MQNKKKVQKAKGKDSIMFAVKEEEELMAKGHLETKRVANT